MNRQKDYMEEFTLTDFMKILYKRMKLILICFLIINTIAVLFYFKKASAVEGRKIISSYIKIGILNDISLQKKEEVELGVYSIKLINKLKNQIGAIRFNKFFNINKDNLIKNIWKNNIKIEGINENLIKITTKFADTQVSLMINQLIINEILKTQSDILNTNINFIKKVSQNSIKISLNKSIIIREPEAEIMYINKISARKYFIFSIIGSLIFTIILILIYDFISKIDFKENTSF